MVDDNLETALQKVDQQFKKWTRRQLSTLGKILIVKVFGISMLTYLMQTIVLNETHYKKINHVLFKFIWNRHYLAAKAPERISREIVSKPVRAGGLGLIDIGQLDKALKIKAYGRLINTRHPFLGLIRNKVDMDCFFYSLCRTKIEPMSEASAGIVSSIRCGLWEDNTVITNRFYVLMLKNLKLTKILNEVGKISIAFRLLWNQGKRKIADLSLRDLQSLRPFIKRSLYDHATSTVNLQNIPALQGDDLYDYIYNGKIFKRIINMSSKEIRESRMQSDAICVYKLGLIMTPRESATWLYNLNKVQSTQLKNYALLTLHGAMYSNERCYRFGMRDDPNCPRCDGIETISHKILECDYVKRIWSDLIARSSTIVPEIDATADGLEQIFIVTANPDSLMMTLHLEVLMTILRLRQDMNYLIRPRILVNSAIKKLILCERKQLDKEILRTLLR